MNTKSIRDYGIVIGNHPTGKLNRITDVPGVLVGHCTLDTEKYKTGVTVIIPGEGNIYTDKAVAAAHVINGFGKSQGFLQLNELGQLETPIALTSTLNVGLVHDALVEYSIKRCAEDNCQVWTVNPVVGETNDCRLSRAQDRPVKKEHVFAAIDAACREFDQGDVGAGKGTTCFGFKGGIGASSRLLTLGEKTYTIGVLVQSNFGSTWELMIDGKHTGRSIYNEINNPSVEDKGSIMIVAATDLPLSSRQINRMIRHAAVGLARTGSLVGQQSGDFAIGFTTANRIPSNGDTERRVTAFNENCMEPVFNAYIEAVEESILNSLTMSDSVTGYDGDFVHSLNDFLPRYI